MENQLWINITNHAMNAIFRTLAAIARLPVTGCIFHRNRDFSDDQACPKSCDHNKQTSELPQGRQPGLMTGALPAFKKLA